MRVAVLVVDDVFDVGLSAVLDTLDVANDLAAQAGNRRARFQVTKSGVRRRARTHQGLTLSLELAPHAPRPDVVIVPALGAKTPEGIVAALARKDVVAALDVVARWSAAGTVVAAACTGTFLLAEAGVLDGCIATTTWWLAPLFRERYARVELEESRMVIESKRAITAGAALAHVDLALAIVRRASPAVASMTARYLVTDERPSQAAYAIADHLVHDDPIVRRFETWAHRSLTEPFSLSAAARSSGASERTLLRRSRAVLGKSPLAYLQDLRVERAVHLLKTTDASVDEVAASVGYHNGATLRTLMRRLGRGVRELRAAAR